MPQRTAWSETGHFCEGVQLTLDVHTTGTEDDAGSTGSFQRIETRAQLVTRAGKRHLPRHAHRAGIDTGGRGHG